MSDYNFNEKEDYAILSHHNILNKYQNKINNINENSQNNE
jgi:hypothetical protein